jgi:hypothetical protein
VIFIAVSYAGYGKKDRMGVKGMAKISSDLRVMIFACASLGDPMISQKRFAGIAEHQKTSCKYLLYIEL